MLDLADIQRGVLGPRPSPYAGAYILLRIDDPLAGRAVLKRLTPLIASAADLTSPLGDAWLAVALSYPGIAAVRDHARRRVLLHARTEGIEMAGRSGQLGRRVTKRQLLYAQ